MKSRVSPRFPLPFANGGGHFLPAPANSLGAEAKLDPISKMSFIVSKILAASAGR